MTCALVARVVRVVSCLAFLQMAPLKATGVLRAGLTAGPRDGHGAGQGRARVTGTVHITVLYTGTKDTATWETHNGYILKRWEVISGTQVDSIADITPCLFVNTAKFICNVKLVRNIIIISTLSSFENRNHCRSGRHFIKRDLFLYFFCMLMKRKSTFVINNSGYPN